LGTPSGRLLRAANANNVLADCLATGIYEISERRLVKTASPSMDILISSNLERLLYETSEDGGSVQRWMDDLKNTGRFKLGRELFSRLRQDLIGDWVDTETCLRTIGRVYRELDYLIDPHTAVAWEVADRHARDLPMVVVSPAHWAKFPADVMRGLKGFSPGHPLDGDEFELLDEIERLAPDYPAPSFVHEMRTRPVRFTEVVAGDREALETALRRWLSHSP